MESVSLKSLYNLNKDLSKIGRELSRIMIIDNLPDNFKLQVNNGFPIKNYIDDMKDTQIIDIGKILKGKFSFFII